MCIETTIKNIFSDSNFYLGLGTIATAIATVCIAKSTHAANKIQKELKKINEFHKKRLEETIVKLVRVHYSNNNDREDHEISLENLSDAPVILKSLLIADYKEDFYDQILLPRSRDEYSGYVIPLYYITKGIADLPESYVPGANEIHKDFVVWYKNARDLKDYITAGRIRFLAKNKIRIDTYRYSQVEVSDQKDLNIKDLFDQYSGQSK
jgi:hypothetical protein